MPQDFWDWLGNIAKTIVNDLITAGQLIYGGLVAMGTFLVNLAEAIWEWGMQAAGQVSQAVVEAVEKVGQVLGELVNLFVSAVSAAIETLLQPIEQWTSSVIAAAQEVVEAALSVLRPNWSSDTFCPVYRDKFS